MFNIIGILLSFLLIVCTPLLIYFSSQSMPTFSPVPSPTTAPVGSPTAMIQPSVSTPIPAPVIAPPTFVTPTSVPVMAPIPAPAPVHTHIKEEIAITTILLIIGAIIFGIMLLRKTATYKKVRKTVVRPVVHTIEKLITSGTFSNALNKIIGEPIIPDHIRSYRDFEDYEIDYIHKSQNKNIYLKTLTVSKEQPDKQLIIGIIISNNDTYLAYKLDDIINKFCLDGSPPCLELHRLQTKYLNVPLYYVSQLRSKMLNVVEEEKEDEKRSESSKLESAPEMNIELSRRKSLDLSNLKSSNKLQRRGSMSSVNPKPIDSNVFLALKGADPTYFEYYDKYNNFSGVHAINNVLGRKVLDVAEDIHSNPKFERENFSSQTLIQALKNKKLLIKYYPNFFDYWYQIYDKDRKIFKGLIFKENIDNTNWKAIRFLPDSTYLWLEPGWIKNTTKFNTLHDIKEYLLYYEKSYPPLIEVILIG